MLKASLLDEMLPAKIQLGVARFTVDAPLSSTAKRDPLKRSRDAYAEFDL